VVRSCAIAGRGAADRHTDRVYINRWSPGAYTRRIREVHALLRGRVKDDCCTCVDAVEVIQAPGDCVLYVDPPYAGSAKPVYVYTFTDEDHRRLAAALHATDQPWLLTYGDHRLVRALYALDVVESVTSDQKSRATKGAVRSTTTELLICPAAYRHLLLPGVPDVPGNVVEFPRRVAR